MLVQHRVAMDPGPTGVSSSTHPVPIARSGIAVLLVLLAAVTAACSPDDSPVLGPTATGTQACEEFIDPVDPASLTHVIAGGPEPTYLTEPPTSGPHVPLAINSDTPTEPIDRPRQVGALEGGQVLVQYRPEVAGAERERLLTLAGDGVIVAPNSEMTEPVVATAWIRRLVCREVSDLTVAAIDAFTEAYLESGPGHG